MKFTPLVLCFIFLYQGTNAFSNTSLINAFIQVFDVQDEILSVNVDIMQLAMMQLQKSNILVDSLCELPEDTQALILMQNARANAVFQLQDQQDWHLMINENGFYRERSYQSIRFAVIETLLLITVMALAYSIWAK